jgi:tellurite resistance protein TerC
LRIARSVRRRAELSSQSILASASLAGWAALIAAVIGLLAFDLFFAHRGDEHITLRRAAGWSALWMVVGVAFGLVVLAALGSAEAGSYWAGFLMEKALSLDNVFVIAVLLGTFAVPEALKADVLTFGIAVALMLRTVFIVAGVALLELFHPVLYAMGALLIVTGIRLATSNDSGEDFAEGRTMRALRRVLPIGKEFHGRAIAARENGARVATPLLAALLAVALADVIFAIDSIPAVLAITTDTFLVFAANAFALLGLRALYFLLDGMAQKFEYLHYGLGALLVFVGAKMLVEDIVGHLPVGVSLAVIVAVLGASVGASLLFSGRRSASAV